MSAINEREFFPSSTVNVDTKAPTQQIQQTPVINPDKSTVTTVDNRPSVDSIENNMDSFISQPTSLETKSSPNTFDWDKGERYRNSKNFKEFGYDPNAAPITDENGKTIDPNEARYAAVQTGAEKAYNAVVGGGKLFMDTFTRQAESWGDLVKGISTLASTGSWAKAQEAYIGTPAELEQMNKEQQDIMNKYAIFNGPKDDTIFSSSFIANSIQQFGLGAGQTVEMLAEVGLTWGAGIAIDAIRAGSIAAKMTEAGRVAEQALNAAKATGDAGDVLKAQEAAKGLQGSLTEANGNKAFASLPQQEKVKQLQNVFDEIQKLSDISTNKELVTDMWKELSGVGRGLKNITPGGGLLDLGSDLYKAGKGVTGSDNVFKNIFTGAQNWGAWKGGVGSLAKDLSLFNMASTHGKLLAFTTYGAQYGDLVTQYERDHDGQLPTGDALEIIKNNAMMAAKDVFTLNVPLIMLMGKIEWGGLFSKFSTAARTMKGLEPELAEGGESTLYSVRGKLAEGAALGEEEKVGDVAYRAYEKETKMFPAIRTFNTVRKDFGLGTALWQGAKVWGPSQLHKFEIAEGLHLLLQTVSDTHFRDYYKKVYDGSVDIHGHSFWDATNTGTWTKEMLEGFNNHQAGQGFQTFIMGATGGLFMTPIHTLLSGVREKVMTNVSPAYKEASENRKAIVNENLKLMNTFYKDPKNVLKTHIDAIKSTGLATNNMADAASQGNKYAYHNAKNDLFAKTVSTFIKNGEFDSFLYTMKNMGNMDAKEFYEACPNMKPTDMGDDVTKYPQPKVVVDNIIQGVTEYYNRWNALKNKFSDLITPEYYEGRASKELQTAEERRAKAHQDLLNEYSDVKTGEDHLKLSDEDKVKNEQRFNELQQKQIKVEDIFNKNVADNKYYNAQMQKRALDEAIECIATLDYQSKKALERKMAIEGQFIDPKEVGVSISKHGSRILNTLGDKKATAKEILNIKKQLQILKPIEGQKELEDTKIQREAFEKQLESLQQWQTAYNVEESHQKHSDEDKETLKVLRAGLPNRTANLENLQNAHKGYIDGLNDEVGQTATPISKEEFDKSLSLLSEHINLSKDYGDYVKALNVITDPKGFQSLHDRIFDGMSYAMFDRYVREKQLLESYANYQKDKSEKEQEAKDIQDKKDRELSNLQKMKLSSLLNTVESDIKRVEASKEEIEKLIVETEAKLPSIEEDLKVAQSLLKENLDTPKNRKEFRKLEQSLRGKVKYLKNTVDRLKEQSQDISLSLESLSTLKERYSRAIEELERTSKPFESLHNIKDIEESITKEQPNELTQKYQGYKIEYAIQETQDQIDELNSRIEHFQKVVDVTEKAINDIFNIVNFTDEDGGYPKRSLEIQQQQLIEKFENYSQDLKDAQSYLQILNEKHQRLVQTKEARENIALHIDTLEYISTIKEALKEKKVDVSSNKTETTETKKTQEQKQKVKEKRVDNTAKEVVSNALSGTPLSQEAKDDLTPEIKNAIKEAQEKLEQLKENVEAYPNGTDSEKEQLQKEEEAKIKAELEEQVKQLLEDDVELWDPKLNGLYEPPKAINGYYKLSLPNPIGTRSFKTKREYNDALRAYVENESKPGGKFEKIEGTDFQKGQTIYNKQGEAFLIQTGANDEGRVELKQKGKNNKINASIKTLNADYSDSLSELKPPTNPIENVEKTRDNPTVTVIENENGEKTLDSHKINFNDIFGIQLSKNKNESEADAALRFTNFILNNGVQLIGDDATLELTALQNKEYKGENSYTENLFENPNIRMRKAPLVYQLNIKVGNKIEPVYLRPNAAYYEFNVNGQWITPLQLIERADGKKLFYEFFNPPAEFYDKESSVTTTDIYNSFKNDIKKSAALDIVLSKMKDRDQLKGTQVTDLLGFDIVSYMRYGGDNALKNETYPYSPLSEIPVSNSNYAKTVGAPTITLNGQEFPAIIVNNKIDADKKPFILWADPEATSLEDSPIYQSTKQYRGDYPGTYSLLHQLSTGEIHWIELSPFEMSIQEVSQRLSAIDKLIATHDGDLVKYLNDVPGGSEAVNNYLKDIFIVTNPYHTKGVIDENQKWKIVPALSQYQEGNKLKKETGEWGMTLHISQTIGEKEERQEFHLTMEKPSFSSVKDFVDSINRTLHERDSSGELKHKALAPLKVSEDDFRNQVFEDDINSIMNMKTNYAVANNNIVDKVDVLWHFKGDYEKIINDAMPKVIAKPVYSDKALEALKNKIINEKELSSDMMGNIFKVINEKEYNDWLEKQDMQSYEAANNNKLALAENNDHLYRIISKDFLPLFIDYKTQKSAFELTLANSKLLINNDYYQKEGQWFREDGTPVVDLQTEINSITAGTPIISEAQINEKLTKQQVLENETTTPSTPVETVDWSQAFEEHGDNRKSFVEKRIGKEEHFDLVSIDNIEEFNKWCEQNLPTDILSVEDRGVFIKNLLDNNVTVGTFYSYMEGINQKGKMSVYKNTPFKYHEAFHGVFRLLLNQQQIDQLLSIAAKENFATPEKLQAFREKGYNYAEHEIKARFYEEYLADKFEAWKQNHKTDTSHVVKSFFRKIVDFFKELWAKLSGNKIEGLFYEINRGKFRNARLQENMFTGQKGIAINQPALKSIPVGTQEINGTIINRYLPQQDANNLSSSIAALFLKQLNSDPIYQRTKKYDKNTILDNILDMYAETFDLSNKDRMDAYKKLADSNFKDPEEKRRWREKLFDRAYLFNKYEKDGKTPNLSRKYLKESVDEYLKIFGLKQKLDADKAEADELEDGILNTNKLERESAFTIGGFGALPTLMRQFIGTTTYTLEEKGKRDEFFNHSFSNGQPMVMAVDANKVYNGMLKCLSNTSDSKVILDKIINFIQNDNNPETKQFINFLFENAGIDPKNVKDSCGNIIATKNANLLQQVVKAFNQYFVNTKYIGIIGDKFTVSDANVKDASYYQISNWQNNFTQTFYNNFIANPTQEKLKTATNSLRILKNLIDYKDTTVTDHTINEKSKEISNALENYLGISLHPDYIKYSILKSKVKPDDQPQTLTKEQKDWVSSYPLVTEIQPGPLENLIGQLNSDDKNIFSKDEKGAKTSYQTLKFWADGNMIFDEGINLMSHTNAAGENVTNYVLPFYSAVQIGDMNKGYTEWLKGLSTDFQKEVENNPLLKNDNFKYLMNKGMLSVEFIDGMRLEKETGDDEEEIQNEWVDTYVDPETGKVVEGGYKLSDKKVRMDKSKEGLTYTDFNDKDFISSLFSFYNIIGQNDCQVFKSKDSSFYRVLVPIRVPAEKSMFSIIKLPVIHSVLKNAEGKITLTENALSILYNRIEEEFNRIRDVHNMTSDNKPLSGHNKIEDWNTGKMKGLKLFVTEDWVGSELKKDIETEAKKEDGNLSSLKEKIEKQLNKYLLGDKGQVQQMINKMVKEGMIIEDDGDYVSAGRLENQGLVPGYLFNGLGEKEDGKLFLSKGNFKQNVAQVYINAFLNTSLINNLLHGDESKLYKNSTYIVKRESGTMATGPSMEGVIADKNVGVEKALKEYYHLTYTDETVNKKLTPDYTLEVDDGHGLCTAKGYLYMLYGKGTLNTTQAAILQKLINGQKVTPEEFFESGGLKDNGAFNSLKMVHNDGQVYLKFSITPLFKSFTSYRDSDGFWKARPGKEALHDLRVALENFEDRKETVAIAHPTSSSKMLTRNVYDTSKGFKNVEDHHFEKLQTKFFKEQLQNPSNKVEITDPSQPKLQLPAEQNLDTLTMYKGKMVPIEEVLKIYMDNIAQRISNNFTTARDGLFKIEDVTKNIKDSIDAGKVTPELAKFLTSAKENLEATGANSQMLEFMELDKNGQPKYNINFPSILPKIESIFFSYFSKGVLRETVPGHSMALVSPAHGAGLQVKEVKSIWTQADIDKYGEDQKLLGQPKEWVVVTQREFEKSPKKYNQLKKYNNKDERRFDGLEKALKKGPVYILDDLRDNYLKFKNNEPIGYFTEALIPAHFKEQAINGFTDEDRFGFGTRIPYVDKNSATSFEFVDQLPVEMGSVIMAAREYYERTGADNDIDKDYVSVPDTYVNSGGERIQYGYAKTEQGQFNEYVHYLLNNNKDVKSLYYRDKLYTTDGVIQALTDNFDKDARIKNVLKDLKLPSNIEEFIKAGGVKLNNGVLNNNILAAKIAMLNNKETVKNANTPTTTQPLIDVVDDLVKDFEEFKDKDGTYGQFVYNMLTEKNADVNSFLGMVNDRAATMMGADSIGSVATANIVYSFLNHMKVDLRNSAITIDGHSFNSFNNVYAWDKETQSYKNDPKTRIFAALACLTNTMTDNAKERNANKLNLGKTATGFAAYLLATGMPEKTAYLYMIQPSMLQYTKLKTSGILSTEGESLSATTYLKSRIKELTDAKVIAKELTTQDLIDNIKEDGIDESKELAILQDIQKMEKQSETYFKVAKVLRLNQGIKGTMEDFDTILSDLKDLGIKIENGKIEKIEGKEFEKLPTCIDIRDALTKNHSFMADILNAVKQIDSCMPSMFIERTELFKNMTDGAMKSLVPPVSPIELPKFKRDLKYDLISYLSIRALKNALETPGNPLYQQNNSLNQNLIYGESDDNIVNKIQKVKDALKNATKKGVTNYLLEYYLVTSEPSDKTGYLHVVEANTWAKLSDIQQNKLIASFVDLYQDAYKRYGVYTHDLANDMFNYLLVKDGGQFKNGSFIKMLPPFIFKDIMNKIGTTNEAMKSNSSYESLFGKGVNEQSLLTEFLKGYTTHIANKKLILNVPYSDSTRKLIVKQKLQGEGNSIVVNAFGDIRANNNNTTDKKIGGFSEVEKQKLKDNKEKLSEAGFTMNDGSLSFPMAFQQGNRLYTLKEVYQKNEEEGKWKPVLTDSFLAKGEFVPTGLKAKYVETEWTGSKNQFPAASAIGPVPVYKLSEMEQKYKNRLDKSVVKDASRENMKNKGYTKKIISIKLGDDKTASVEKIVTPEGKLVGTKGELYTPNIENGVITSVTDASSRNVQLLPTQLLGDLAKLDNIIKAKEVVPSQPTTTQGNKQVIPLTENFSRQSVKNDSKHLYLFTDNAKRTSGSNKIEDGEYTKKYGQGNYPTMTQAVIRGLDNAMPITTMVDDKRTQWNDSKFNEYKKIIDSEIVDIKDKLSSSKYDGLKFAGQMPFGKGQISDMKNAAPKIWNYLNERLKEIGIDNTGEKPIATITQGKNIKERSQALLDSVYTSDELNNLFKNRKDKTRNSVQYRDKINDVTKGVLEMNWNSKKEQQESLKSIINCL